jgi:hypothetical protein
MTAISSKAIPGHETISVPDYAKNYIGGNDYALTADFRFAELARRLDMSIRDLVAAQYDMDLANEIRYKGWGQLIAMAYLTGNRELQRDVSDKLVEKMTKAVQDSLASVSKEDNPIGKGLAVTQFTKPALMNATHPEHPSKYLDWQPVEGDHISKSLQTLTRLAQGSLPNFELKAGSILLMVKGEQDKSIFAQIWESDFKQQMEACGFNGLARPIIEPHLTLVDSQEIAKLSAALGDRFEEELGSILDELTKELKKESDYLQFSGIKYTFSTEFSTYTDVIVATVHSPAIDNLMNSFRERVKNSYNTDIKTKPMQSFHLTLGGTPRPSLPLPSGMQVDALINGNRMHVTELSNIWNDFCKSQARISQ